MKEATFIVFDKPGRMLFTLNSSDNAIKSHIKQLWNTANKIEITIVKIEQITK